MAGEREQGILLRWCCLRLVFMDEMGVCGNGWNGVDGRSLLMRALVLAAITLSESSVLRRSEMGLCRSVFATIVGIWFHCERGSV